MIAIGWLIAILMCITFCAWLLSLVIKLVMFWCRLMRYMWTGR